MSIAYELGPFRLNPEAGVLTRAGLPMALGARAVAVLTVLVKSPNEYVTKDHILDVAWPGVIVEDNSLAAQISAIRRVLAGEPGGEAWIETLPRRGYRFAGPVTTVRDGISERASAKRINSNLPEPLTSFIGRERELAEIKLLLPTTRLMTLGGVGGVGKTRFALQLAAEVTEAYRDGVWLVDLALLSDPTLVPSAVAQALGVREVARKPILETLCAEFRERQVLLLLDNCEHLLAACAHLANALLHAARELTILATSREPLCLTGEQTYSLPTLSLPDAAASAQTMGSSEAVQLFVARAQQQEPAFSLTSHRWSNVAQICIRLDGIPLALELAAARVRTLTVEQINERLDDRFRLLTGGARTALPRQQTLRATLDWSYELLTEEERAVLQRLAVFSGGFTLEAASSVASDESIDEFAAIDIISQLVSRSLLVADTNDASARYRLLETTRSYALQRLAEAGHNDVIQERHAKYFRRRFQRAPDDWLRIPEDDWRASYATELDNVRAALDWALGSRGNTEIGIGLCSGSGPVWMELSLGHEGCRRIEAALTHVRDTPLLDEARLWFWLGMLRGDAAPAESMRANMRAVELYRQLGEPSALGFALVQLAFALGGVDRLEEAARALAEAGPLLRDSGLPRALARHSEITGFLKMRTGDLSGARSHYENALALYRTIGVQREVLRMLGNNADLTWALGDLDAALAGFQEAIALLRKSTLVTKSTLGFALTNLAGVRTERGELEEALAAMRDGIPLMDELGYAWINMDHFALRAGLAGKFAHAARLSRFADSEYLRREATRGPNEIRARNRLRALLEERLTPDEFERFSADGANLVAGQACQLALED